MSDRLSPEYLNRVADKKLRPIDKRLKKLLARRTAAKRKGLATDSLDAAIDSLSERRDDIINRRFEVNPAATIFRGWVLAKAIKIVRNKRGQAIALRIKT